jgi:hypothetical protein
MSVKTNNMQRGYDVVIAMINQHVPWIPIRLRLAATKAFIF